MKIFETAKIREADELTINSQNITSLELMERASNEVFLWLKRKFPDKETVFHVFCGKGNNGGDGLVIARLLHADNYTVLLTIVGQGSPSADFSASLEKVNDAGMEYNAIPDVTLGKEKAIIIDAIFGIGFNRVLDEEHTGVIELINNADAHVISIDVPSGLYMDRPTEIAVHADEVLTFQFPKLAFYMAANYRFVKKVHVIDIGLDKNFVDNTHTDTCLTDRFDIKTIYKTIPHHAHKGTQGHALIIGGSYGKTGAVTLSAKAALKSGCGLITAYLPECGYIPLQSSFPEAMVITNGAHHIQDISYELKPAAIGIGPGLGQHKDTQAALQTFLQNNKAPLVIDADALNILSENKDWLHLLPQDTILTPHPKELERLLGPWQDDFDRLDKLKQFSLQFNSIIVAKDARTIIVGNGEVFINSTGNPALATAGSGDVLTGIITGLVAQGYTPLQAAILGVYLHGLTADIGVTELGTHAFTASSVLKYLGKAFMQIEADCRL